MPGAGIRPDSVFFVGPTRREAAAMEPAVRFSMLAETIDGIARSIGIALFRGRRCMVASKREKVMRERASRGVAIAISLLVCLAAPASIRAGERGSLESGPGFRSERYQRVLVSPLRVVYSNDPDTGQRHDREIAPEDLLRFQRHYREAVEKQLGKAYPIVTEPGADVLRIETVLIDPVVDKSAWNAAAKTVYSELQTVRLIVVLRDSRTDDVLHRVELPARLGTSRWSEQNAVTYWGQVRLVFSQLATRVQWTLEGVDQPAHF